MNYNDNHYDLQLALTEADYNLQVVAAECLGITLDEYLDFVVDMQVDTIEYTLEEIEDMYAEYCQEYDILCMQIDIGVPMKLYGAI